MSPCRSKTRFPSCAGLSGSDSAPSCRAAGWTGCSSAAAAAAAAVPHGERRGAAAAAAAAAADGDSSVSNALLLLQPHLGAPVLLLRVPRLSLRGCCLPSDASVRRCCLNNPWKWVTPLMGGGASLLLSYLSYNILTIQPYLYTMRLRIFLLFLILYFIQIYMIWLLGGTEM